MKIHEVKGTPFFLWYGGREVEGQCKWVVDCDDVEILDDFSLDWDTLYCDKYEAMQRCTEWWIDNADDYTL
ncbi:MAG: hypothetical protein Unbinned1446contig1005_42 [Prokaryotic dsDNA virus sp.]|nr:MAG: hypothetical protein Unbinned1446contig1005_42 [Prokaryotic dsDNA virus sp.]|tara:strand:+ start:4390 stop:4602 length:213 start_codon:yes stop_codon:yes gene_type:complete